MSYQSIAKVNEDLSVEHVRIQDTTPVLKSIEEHVNIEQTGENRLAARIPLAVLGSDPEKTRNRQPVRSAQVRDDERRRHQQIMQGAELQ